jgi:hypothetical protein
MSGLAAMWLDLSPVPSFQKSTSSDLIGFTSRSSAAADVE